MMMDPIADPYNSLFGDGQLASISGDLLFGSGESLGGFDLDLPLTTPTSPTAPSLSKTAALFETSLSEQEQETMLMMMNNPEFKLDLDNLITDLAARDSSDSSMMDDLFTDFQYSPLAPSESSPTKITPNTCDAGTDPMVEPMLPAPPPPHPVIINTTKSLVGTQHLPRSVTATKVVHLTTTANVPFSTLKGNVIHFQAANNSNKTQANYIQIASCLPSKPTLLIAAPLTTTNSSSSTTNLTTLPAGCYTLQLDTSITPSSTGIEEITTTMDDGQMDDSENRFLLDCDDDHLPMTPSTSSESADDRTTTSPDTIHDNIYIKAHSHRHHPYSSASKNSSSSSSMLTDLGKLPSSGPLLLTDEELKLIKQEGYQIPAKLPLNKTEEKILKKIRRKIKNKISAQESRRKKKEYVDTLERQVAKYMDENGSLRERVSSMEKNQKTLMQELQSLRSMVGKGTTATGTVLMVLVLFFAVLFGIWSPIVNKQTMDDFMRTSNDGSSAASSNSQDTSTNLRRSETSKSILDQQDLIKQEPTYYATQNYKSRVLLSFDEHDHHYHGPYLPANSKFKSSSMQQQQQQQQQQAAAPAYTYSNAVEKYMNKKFHYPQKEETTNYSTYQTPTSGCRKRPHVVEPPSIVLAPDSTFTTWPNHKSNYRINEKVVVFDTTSDKLGNEETLGESSSTFEGKPLKIIRVERTTPAVGNDTLKLSHRTVHE